MPFALATFMSTVLREFDLGLVRSWNVGHSEYWGKVGHYKIAATALRLVKDERLRTLLTANADRIAYDDDALRSGQLVKAGTSELVPLADVADLLWRNARPNDSSNHFADMDQPGDGDFAGKTLLDLVDDSKDNLDVEVWNQFYESIGSAKRGALPFRVWQMYDLMVGYLQQGDVIKFVCAGGLMSHYAGDACQPLHVSMLHHGHPDQPAEHDVHEVFETRMLDAHAAELIDAVNSKVAGKQVEAGRRGGKAAATAEVALMSSTIERLPPQEIINAFNEVDGRGRTTHMYEVLGDDTAQCLADGAIALAKLWATAWAEGGGEEVSDQDIRVIDEAELIALYLDKSFVPSFRLQDPSFAAALAE